MQVSVHKGQESRGLFFFIQIKNDMAAASHKGGDKIDL